jgi:hypothetical protein
MNDGAKDPEPTPRSRLPPPGCLWFVPSFYWVAAVVLTVVFGSRPRRTDAPFLSEDQWAALAMLAAAFGTALIQFVVTLVGWDRLSPAARRVGMVAPLIAAMYCMLSSCIGVLR